MSKGYYKLFTDFEILLYYFSFFMKIFGRVYFIVPCNPTIDIVLWNTLNYSNTELDIGLNPHIHPVCENSEYKVHTTLD